MPDEGGPSVQSPRNKDRGHEEGDQIAHQNRRGTCLVRISAWVEDSGTGADVLGHSWCCMASYSWSKVMLGSGSCDWQAAASRTEYGVRDNARLKSGDRRKDELLGEYRKGLGLPFRLAESHESPPGSPSRHQVHGTPLREELGARTAGYAIHSLHGKQAPKLSPRDGKNWHIQVMVGQWRHLAGNVCYSRECSPLLRAVSLFYGTSTEERSPSRAVEEWGLSC